MDEGGDGEASGDEEEEPEEHRAPSTPTNLHDTDDSSTFSQHMGHQQVCYNCNILAILTL